MDAVTDNLPDLLEGTWRTIQITGLGFFGALVLGMVMASFRVSPIPPLRVVGGLYVEVIRNVPLIVQMTLVYFGFPKVGFTFSPFTAAVLVMSVYTGSFVTEAVRSGINSVPKGQAEAARSLGLPFAQVLGLVVLPQALRTVVQPLASILIASTKNSAVAYAISVPELTGTANRLGTDTAEPLVILFAAGLGYLVLTIPMGVGLGVLERRVAVRR